MHNLTLTKLGAWFRSALLLMCGCALVTWGGWFLFPATIDAVDKKIQELYLSPFQSKLTLARELAESDQDEAISVYEDLLEELHEFGILDRLGRIKQNAFTEVVDLYESRKDYKGALHWLDEWTKYRERNVNAQSKRAMILYMGFEERKAEATELIKDLFRRFPENTKVFDHYLAIMYGNGSYVDMVVAYYSQQKTGWAASIALAPWEVFWDVGAGFAPDKRLSVTPRIDKGSQLMLEFSLDEFQSLRRIRVDLPASKRMSLLSATFVIEKDGVIKRFPLREMNLQLNEITMNSGLLTSEGGIDPYMYWSAAHHDQGLSVEYRLEARVVPPPPEWLIDVANKTELNWVFLELEDRGHVEIIEKLRGLRFIDGGQASHVSRDRLESSLI